MTTKDKFVEAFYNHPHCRYYILTGTTYVMIQPYSYGDRRVWFNSDMACVEVDDNEGWDFFFDTLRVESHEISQDGEYVHKQSIVCSLNGLLLRFKALL